ncbi:MAG: tetratricopeptide repeat protein [Verrucomicrobiota bacterium]|nr:tetratricopeptide repeat protein [Verrucomicrobiota bacterium]
MAAETDPEPKLEIAHILTMDVVEYSTLFITQQREVMQELNQVVRQSAPFRQGEADGKLVRLPTGDGMALVFLDDPEAPLQCALEISAGIKEHPNIRLRMGIHSGPVSQTVDVNDRSNLAGAGLDIAQRVMDCGDAGHILLSKHVADDLEPYARWHGHLHELGEHEVKHGRKISLVNFYTNEVGNPEVPKIIRNARAVPAGTRRSLAARKAALLAAGALALLALILWGEFGWGGRGGARAPAAPEKSIAVLPFQNMSEEKDSAFFADGIQDDVLTSLAKIHDLKVISRTSVMAYRDTAGRNLREIGRALGVVNILEGSVRRIADRVLIHVRLTDSRNARQIWAERYDRTLADSLTLQGECATEIATALRARLSPEEKASIETKPTMNAEAYDAYLRGLAFEARNYSAGALEKMTGYYRRAVELDPNFAQAWARLSRADARTYFSGNDKSFARRDAAERALNASQRLQPGSPETMLAQAYYQYWVLRDYELARATFGRVQKVLPGTSEIPSALARIARRQGRWDESTAHWRQALAVDPRNSEWLTDAAWTYSMLRQYEPALEMYNEALELLPNDPDLIASIAQIYQAEGNLEQAGKSLAGVNAYSPSAQAFIIKIIQLFLERRYDEAMQLLELRLTEPPADMSDFERGYDQQLLAFAQEFAGDTASAKATARQARQSLETVCRKEPDNANSAATLSRALALLGEKEAALKEAERAMTLRPSANDAVMGPAYEENSAIVQARVGETSQAISTLQHLLEIPYNSFLYGNAALTPALLRLDPTWDPLRADPRFQKLCEEINP